MQPEPVLLRTLPSHHSNCWARVPGEPACASEQRGVTVGWAEALAAYSCPNAPAPPGLLGDKEQACASCLAPPQCMHLHFVLSDLREVSKRLVSTGRG